VDAAYRAIEKALGIECKLVEYHIDAVTEGMDAQGRVHVTLISEGRRARGTGSDTDVIVASARAFLNAANRVLAQRQAGTPAKEPEAKGL
jgi:2-isopropylmalate synthase